MWTHLAENVLFGETRCGSAVTGMEQIFGAQLSSGVVDSRANFLARNYRRAWKKLYINICEIANTIANNYTLHG